MKSCYNCLDAECRQTQLQIFCLQGTVSVSRILRETSCDDWRGKEPEPISLVIPICGEAPGRY